MSDVKSDPRKGPKSAFELGVPKTFRVNSFVDSMVRKVPTL